MYTLPVSVEHQQRGRVLSPWLHEWSVRLWQTFLFPSLLRAKRAEFFGPAATWKNRAGRGGLVPGSENFVRDKVPLRLLFMRYEEMKKDYEK